MAHTETAGNRAGGDAHLITVIIPTYNMADTLSAAICSAFVSGATAVTVFDDQSEDNPWGVYLDLLNTYGKALKYFRPFSFRAGVVTARNYAIQHSDYGFIVPLDADDTLLPGSLQALVEAWQPGHVVYGNWHEGGQDVKAPPPDMVTRKHVCHATYLFHKTQWEAVGGYPADFNIGGEDWALLSELSDSGARLIHIDTPIYHRGGVNARTAAARNRAVIIHSLMRQRCQADALEAR